MSDFSAPQWGTHAQFAELFEDYLDAVYESSGEHGVGDGRWRLTESIATELRARGVRTVLDCAAGTGFPALDLAATDSLPRLLIHCTDADQLMLKRLEERAKALGVHLGVLIPPSKDRKQEESTDSLIVDWKHLKNITRTYDYVMCRGNSLAYADTWGGGGSTTPVKKIRQYLVNMAAKVDLGGYLHVDAPWQLSLPREEYKPVGSGVASIWEQVKTEAEHRHWRVDFTSLLHGRLKFERFSTLLTIHDVQQILDELRFDETEPFELKGERAGYGVIIARKLR